MMALADTSESLQDKTWPVCDEEMIGAGRRIGVGQVIYRGGSEGTLLDNEWAKLLNAQYAIALANRTEALEFRCARGAPASRTTSPRLHAPSSPRQTALSAHDNAIGSDPHATLA